MKKTVALLIALAFILSLAACGNSGKNNAREPGADNTVSGAAQDLQTDAADEPADEAQDDAAAVEALKEQIVGVWGFPGDGGEDAERLTFNADGTGEYQTLNDKRMSFTYEIYIDHRTYNNGAPYTENMFHMEYDTGETEDFIFFFTEAGKLAFHNSDNGGYNGVLDYFDNYTKE
ncbi:MAG: hypothetical protein IJT27_01390 [Clostridia bacterium]|nr:hypothetical protein [Clostridia bacterium]